jgi:hypothetical protein
LQLQPELDQDEEDLKQLDMLIARTLAKIASKMNQQAIQAGQQRISKESNKHLKQVAELQNLTLVGHPAVAGRPIIAGHSLVAAQPSVVGQPTVAGHPTLTRHGMSTVAELPRHGTSTTTDLTILEGHSKAENLADLAHTAKERSTRAWSTTLRCWIAKVTTPRESIARGLECVVGDATTEASGS